MRISISLPHMSMTIRELKAAEDGTILYPTGSGFCIEKTPPSFETASSCRTVFYSPRPTISNISKHRSCHGNKPFLDRFQSPQHRKANKQRIWAQVSRLTPNTVMPRQEDFVVGITTSRYVGPLGIWATGSVRLCGIINTGSCDRRLFVGRKGSI